MKAIHLVLLSEKVVTLPWELGEVLTCQPTPAAINGILSDNFSTIPSEAWLFWDPDLGAPNQSFLMELLDSTADCWHAGLALGLGGKPEMIDFVSPTWMLNRDPDKSIEATSWRLTLRACLVRTEVLRQLGGPRVEFESLEAAGLEMGLRFIRQGAFMRHVPELIPAQKTTVLVDVPLRDQLLFLRFSYVKRWVSWAVFRAVCTRFASLTDLIKTWHEIRIQPAPSYPVPFVRNVVSQSVPTTYKVSVLIPTLNRYPYLRVLLDQLRDQTVPAFEILVIDQTPRAERNLDIKDEFSDLPLHWYFLDQAGQCSSRNYGIQKAKGEFILFLDDDDEIQNDLLEKHLHSIVCFRNNVSNGVVVEKVRAGIPAEFRILRVSNVFPAGNTLIRRSVLKKTGVFDLAFDRGQRADHDLGMRLYINGELMVLDPGITILHHHASTGGLREHKARVDTYAASRSHLFKQILPSISDIYLAKRYYTTRQVREKLWIDFLGTFSVRGSVVKRLLKGLIAVFSLPRNIYLVKKREKIANRMLEEYPRIPNLSGEDI